MGAEGAALAVTRGRPGCRRANRVARTPGRPAFLRAAFLTASLVLPALLAPPHARPVDVPWIPASAGMTESAFAFGESGAAGRVVREFPRTSAFARVAILARIGHAPARGMFLVAAPALRDPNFARTVVLLLEYGESGALGLVINRPTEVSLHDVLAAPLPGSQGHPFSPGAR